MPASIPGSLSLGIGVAYRNYNNLFFAIPGGPSVPLGGRFASPGVYRFPTKCVRVDVVVAERMSCRILCNAT